MTHNWMINLIWRGWLYSEIQNSQKLWMDVENMCQIILRMMLNDAERMWLLQLKTFFSNFIFLDLQNPCLLHRFVIFSFIHSAWCLGNNQPGVGVVLDEFSLTHSIFAFYGFLWPKSSFTQPQRDKGGDLVKLWMIPSFLLWQMVRWRVRWNETNDMHYL